MKFRLVIDCCESEIPTNGPDRAGSTRPFVTSKNKKDDIILSGNGVTVVSGVPSRHQQPSSLRHSLRYLPKMAMASHHPSSLPPATFLLPKSPKRSRLPKPFLLRVAPPSSSSSSSSPDPPGSEPPSEPAAPADLVKLAFEKARAYRKSLRSKPEGDLEASAAVAGSPSDESYGRGGSADAGRIAMAKAKEHVLESDADSGE